tara:strand:- start:11917 stop:12324 length:408 start_codon:yes stop_codon:yes gene_type:complete
MGRYYHITGNNDTYHYEGKFGFASQPSTDPEFFGAMESGYIHYEVYDIEEVEEGLKLCRKKLKGYQRKIDEYFKKYSGLLLNKGEDCDQPYLHEYLGVSKEKEDILMLYRHRYRLGKAIKKCLKTNDSCYIEAEI